MENISSFFTNLIESDCVVSDISQALEHCTQEANQGTFKVKDDGG